MTKTYDNHHILKPFSSNITLIILLIEIRCTITIILKIKLMFYLKIHSIHFIYCFMASDIW